MFIKAMYNNEECLLNADYIVDIFNADKWVADVYVLDIDRDCYKVKQSEIQRLIDDTADTPQTEETCERCVYVRGSQWCQGCNGTPKRWDGEKIVDATQNERSE